jgi:pentatricopeptide repeat protein
MRACIVLLIAVAALAGAPLWAAEEPQPPADAQGPAVTSAEGSAQSGAEGAAPSEGEERVAHILLRSGDVFNSATFELTAKALVVETPYSGKVEIDRNALAGITFGTGRSDRVLDRGKRERDLLQMLAGDTISGGVVRSEDGKLLVKTFYGGGKESAIPLDGIEYVLFATPSEAEGTEASEAEAAAPKPEPGLVRVIFVNGDVVSGTLEGYKNGTFRLATRSAGTLHFTTDEIQSLHNAAKSHQFFPGGLAEAFMRLFESSTEMRRQYMNVLPTLVRGFLSEGDTEDALYIFHHMASYELDWYDLARAFETANLPDAALECYERMYEGRRNNPYVYRQLSQAYQRHGRYAKAAEVYEELLKQATSALPNSGITEAEVHMALAEAYTKTGEPEKAITHLRAVLNDAAADPAMRQQARAALVDSFSKTGQLDELIARYTDEAHTLDEQIGQGYLGLVAAYIERGKFSKARMQHDRLVALGLDEYAAKAKALLDQAESAGGEEEAPAGNDEDESGNGNDTGTGDKE